MRESIWKDGAWRLWCLICVLAIAVFVSAMIPNKEVLVGKITFEKNAKLYHTTLNNMITAALMIEEKSGYDAMRAELVKTQLNEGVLAPIEAAQLPKDLERETVIETLIDIFNNNAEKLGRPPYEEIQ